MARLFNIYFTFEDVLHTAIVSVRTTPFFTEYQLGNLDPKLARLLPGNKLISTQPGEPFFQHATANHSVTLMAAIINSIRQHLLSATDVPASF